MKRLRMSLKSRKRERKEPIRKLDFNARAGTTGKDAISIEDALVLKTIPLIKHASDTANALNGPHKEKSSKSDLVLGNDLIGVMHPNIPSWNEGIGTGNPILICLFLATK